MSSTFLRRHRGAAVKLHINGKPASGVLAFGDDGSAHLASLCYAQGHSECLLRSHVLAEHEIATLRRGGRRQLTSAITLTHADGTLRSAASFFERGTVSESHGCAAAAAA